MSQIEKSAKRDDVVSAASVPTHDVVVVGSGDGTKRRSLFVLNPTTGLLVVRPDKQRVMAKALRSEVRRIYFRLQLRLLLLKFSYFRVSCAASALKVHTKLVCFGR